MAKGKDKADPMGTDVTRRKTSRLLRVELTEVEERQLGKDLARERALAGRAEDGKAEVVAQFKAEIERHEAEMNRLSALINNGYEFRDVACEIVSDYGTGQVSVIRLDNGEEVEARAMTEDERQLNLPAPDWGSPDQPAMGG